jgi:hypothetical protein
MTKPAPTPSPQPPHVLPPRPLCRPAASRAATLCFWTVFLLFLASLGFLALLAYSRNSGQAQPNPGNQGPIFFGFLIVGVAVAVVIGVISSHHQHPR